MPEDASKLQRALKVIAVAIVAVSLFGTIAGYLYLSSTVMNEEMEQDPLAVPEP